MNETPEQLEARAKALEEYYRQFDKNFGRRHLQATWRKRIWKAIRGKAPKEFIYCPTTGNIRLRRWWE